MRYSIFLITILMNLAVAQADEVRTVLTAPFSCKEAENLAKEDLQHQCEKLNLNLRGMLVEDCHQSGSDGGYVDYYDITAHGFCGK